MPSAPFTGRPVSNLPTSLPAIDLLITAHCNLALTRRQRPHFPAKPSIPLAARAGHTWQWPTHLATISVAMETLLFWAACMQVKARFTRVYYTWKQRERLWSAPAPQLVTNLRSIDFTLNYYRTTQQQREVSALVSRMNVYLTLCIT